MKGGSKSTFHLTDQSRYSQDIYKSSLIDIRKRINILSSTQLPTSISSRYQPQPSTIMKTTNITNTSGLYAKVTKMSFDASLIQQDIKTQIYTVRKSRQYLGSVHEGLLSQISNLQLMIKQECTPLYVSLNNYILKNNKNNKKIQQQIGQINMKTRQIKQVLQNLGKQVKIMEDTLGYYSGHQKIHSFI